MREGIGGAQVVARCEEEEGSAGAVWDAKLAGRHGEHAEGTGSRALLFETLDADFKLEPPINLPVLEVAELFVDVVDLGFEAIHRSFDRRESRVDFHKFRVHISSQVGDFLMHACEMRSQR